jgi:signal transduction histidine kinase
MFRNATIRRRLTVIFASSAILILLIAGYLIYTFSASFRKKEFKLRLENRMDQLQEIMRRDPDGPLPPFSKYDDAVLPREQLAVRMLTDTLHLPSPEGTLKLHAAQLTGASGVLHLPLGRRDYALLYDTAIQKLLVVSAIDVYGYTKMNNLRKIIMVCLAVSVLLLAFVSWYWTRRMLAPIAAKIKKAQMIGTGSLNLRLEVTNPKDELGMLATTFNDMLHRLEQGFKTQQQFIGNASHELRTPLTILRSEAEWALSRERSLDEYKKVLHKVQEKSEYLTQLVNRLLIMARINGTAAAKDMTAFRLDEMLLVLVEQLNSQHNGNPPIICRLEFQELDKCFIKGDAAMIQTAISNLVENGVKYGQGTPVQITAGYSHQQFVITVRDNGMGIAPSDAAHIFTPFFRADKARSIASGTGLGLALVKAIAEWHGGSLTLIDSKSGAVFKLSLPAYFT